NACSTTQSFTITQPTALVATASAQTNVACNGGSNGSATVAVTGGTGAYTYVWAPTGGTAATATGLAAGTYTVTVTDANACTTTQSFTITEPGATTVTAQPTNSTITAGGNATFTVTATNATSYQWQMSTNGTTWNNISNGGTNPVVSGATTNTLTLTGVPASYNGHQFRAVVANGTCASVNSNAGTLTVNNLVITAVNDDFSANPVVNATGGVAGDVTANDLLGGAPVNDNAITITLVNNGGLTGVTIDANGNVNVPAASAQGTYTLTYSICEIANSTNCSTATAIVVVAPPMGVADFNAASVSIFPNPAVTTVTIKMMNNYSNASVTVFDMNGRQVIRQNLHNEESSINVDQLEAGVYIFNIVTDQGKTTKRVIKTNK
ncbi:MAG TPA: T9SS type A sorting domain-containing protein, partial [Flavobacterium sp.]|nr:T9SS type A sorting domain-containing protein [Flavobacterium sp.]